MPDLLLELFSEEIPARMQARAADDLKRLMTDALVEAGLVYEAGNAFATPRRLALNVVGIPARQPDVNEERKGPRVGAPEKALEGFLRAAGLASVDQAEIVKDDKKGDYYLARIEKPGRMAEQVIADIIPEIVRSFPWPKSMRWGSGDMRWVRPLQSILCMFGPETEDPVVVQFEIGGVKSGNTTRGHRFMGPGAIKVRRFDDYVSSLEAARVILDADRRREIILTDAKNAAFAQGLELVEDEALLNEVAGLVEWPVVLMGSFDEAFLDVPPEVLTTAMKSHQKCFSVIDPKTGKLANRFILVANLVAKDGGKEIVAGNEKVIAARLADARFFWEQDLKMPLEDRLPALEAITFHEKLGTQAERVKRLETLAREIAPHVGADPEKAARAAHLAKADLVTEMVGEFPELQGLMGKYYAHEAGEDESVAAAIEEHYKPQGPSDAVPTDPISIAVALADKLDTLVGFWAIDEKPTGSKDPFALRRAALGIIRVLLTNSLSLYLHEITFSSCAMHHLGLLNRARIQDATEIRDIALRMGSETLDDHADRIEGGGRPFNLGDAKTAFGSSEVVFDLLAFFHDRLKVYLRDTGARHDLIDAVIAPDDDDILKIVRRVEALGAFLDTDDGANLLAGIKRATNILRIEEKKDDREYAELPNEKLFTEKAEIALNNAIEKVDSVVAEAIEKDKFDAALLALAALRKPVDAFFDDVTVNAENADLRTARLQLLNRIRETSGRIADFSKIEG